MIKVESCEIEVESCENLFFFFFGGEGGHVWGEAIKCLVMMDSDKYHVFSVVATFHVDILSTKLEKPKKLSINSQWHSLNDSLE